MYFFIVIHNHYNNVFRAVTGKENSWEFDRKIRWECNFYVLQRNEMTRCIYMYNLYGASRSSILQYGGDMSITR